MPDLILHRLPFGGLAFEPMTIAGLDWLEGYCSNLGGAPYTNGDACMTGFTDGAAGFEPHDAAQVATDAILAGITWERAE